MTAGTRQSRNLHIDLPEGIIAAMRMAQAQTAAAEISTRRYQGSLYDTAHDLRLRYADEVIAANGVPGEAGAAGTAALVEHGYPGQCWQRPPGAARAQAYFATNGCRAVTFPAAVFARKSRATQARARHLSGVPAAAIHADRALRRAGGRAQTVVGAAKRCGCPADIVQADRTRQKANIFELTVQKDLREVQQIC